MSEIKSIIFIRKQESTKDFVFENGKNKSTDHASAGKLVAEEQIVRVYLICQLIAVLAAAVRRS